jgi:hypothetical protein
VFDRLGLVIARKDFPALKISAGQVGTVVDHLGEDIALVNFSDGEGYSNITTPIPMRWLRCGQGFSEMKKDLISNRAGLLRKS